MNKLSKRARKKQQDVDACFQRKLGRDTSESTFTGETESTGGERSGSRDGSDPFSTLDSSVRSSLRRRQEIENEVAANIVLSSKERRSSISSNRTVQELTVNKLRFSSVGLQGREQEKALLVDCVRKTKKEIVFISGYAGAGKSALANSLMESVEKSGGAHVSGKFDVHSRDQPYTGIAAACHEICGKILSEGDDEIQAIGKELVAELGGEVRILTKVVPALEEVVGSQEVDLQPDRDKHHENLAALSQQLNYAFRLFIRIVCSHFEPLVIVLDDLQWADVASLDLLEALITDRQNARLLVLGCYRSNEVDETHVMSKTRRDLQDKSDRGGGFSISEIQVGNLSLSDVNQVIMSLLGIDDASRMEGLAKICFNRTQGNCFFLLAFVMMLEREGLLEFNLGSFQWTWDCERIEEETASTDNVVDLLVKKMNQLPNDLCQLLQVAACLGSKFDEKVFRLVWEKLTACEDEDVLLAPLLDQAVQQKFLESTGHSGYRWVHDKIKEAALFLVPKSNLSSLQFDIGTILSLELEDQERDSSIFTIVSLLDSVDALEESLNIEIAELSAKAAAKAKELSAFQSAVKYATTGINRLPDGKWETHYELSLELYCTAAKSEGILAHTDSMQAYADEVLANARTFHDKLKVIFVLVDRMGTDGRMQEANELALDALKELKVNLPRNGVIQAFTAISGLFSMKRTLAKVDVEKLPLMTDADKVASMKLLCCIGTFAFWLKDKVLLLNTGIKMIELTVTFGLSPSAPVAFAAFGVLVGGVFKDLQACALYAEIATALVRKLKAKSAEAEVMYRTWAFSLSYTRPLHESLKPFLDGYKVGLQTSDTEGAAYCILCYNSSSFLQSKPLKTIEKDCRIFIPHMLDLGRREIAELSSYLHQASLYLMGRTDSCELIAELTAKSILSKPSCLVYRSAVFAYLGEYEKGADDGIAFGDIVLKTFGGSMSCQGECFTRSVCLYAMARKTNKRKYKKHARKARKTIKSWVQAGNMNSKHHLCLLDAEEAALRGDTGAVVKYSEEAIVRSARSGFLRDAGLANERYAEFLLHEVGDKDQAKYRVQESIRYYQDWGAQRKVDILQTKYAELVEIQANTFISCVPTTLSLEGSSAFSSK